MGLFEFDVGELIEIDMVFNELISDNPDMVT
jgi:hypothetical protein